MKTSTIKRKLATLRRDLAASREPAEYRAVGMAARAVADTACSAGEYGLMGEAEALKSAAFAEADETVERRALGTTKPRTLSPFERELRAVGCGYGVR